jgi:two-component system, OmpR family, response regulator
MSANPASPGNFYPDAVLLCVDDDPSGLDLKKTILEKNGYGVLTARGGIEALRMFRQNRVDLVLSDYEMQGMKGHELALRIKALNPHTPVILHSGSLALPVAAIRATDAFVPKGSEFYTLVAAISSLIMKSRLRPDAIMPASGSSSCLQS